MYATGYPIVSNAGPRPEFVEWKKSGVVETAENSGFDNVFFWDRVHKWCKPLKPVGPTIKKHS